MDRNHLKRPVDSRPAHARSRRVLLAALAAGVVLAGSSASVDAASRSRIQLELAKPQPKQKNMAGRRTKTPKPNPVNQTTSQSVRLEGSLSVARDGTFRLGDDVLLMGSHARALSDDQGRMLKPSAWDGREVTVFGDRVGRGVRVSLVIDHGQASSSLVPSATLPPTAKPSVSDPQVGELTDATPQ